MDENGCCPAPAVTKPAPNVTALPQPERIQPVHACVGGRVLGPDTEGHCCWPGQGWSSRADECAGVPTSCPSGLRVVEADCAAMQDIATSLPNSEPKNAPSVEILPPARTRTLASPEPSEPVRPIWVSPSLGTMRYVPAGKFNMGPDEDELVFTPIDGELAGQEVHIAAVRPHPVTLAHGFYLMEHEVTQSQWLRVMGHNPSVFSSCGPDCPVDSVSWYDAQTFARRVSRRDGVSYRLPSDAEWEYAAWGGQSLAFSGSEDINMTAWNAGNSGKATHPVCGKQRNGLGLCDMCGNVLEWTANWPWDYPKGQEEKGLRGGSWWHAVAVTEAFLDDPNDRSDLLGFRLVAGLKVPNVGS